MSRTSNDRSVLRLRPRRETGQEEGPIRTVHPPETPVGALVERRKAGAARESGAHLGIRLGSSESLSELRERVVAAGHEPRDQERVRCCHAIETKFWLTDPDGNEWEFYELIDDLQDDGKTESVGEMHGR